MKANLITNHDLIPMLMSGLRSQVVAIKFTKADGTIRNMAATLAPRLIPLEHAPKGTAVAEDSEEHPSFVRVFDVNASGWRTIKFSAVREFDAIK